jgi:hypothetical protein
MRRAAAVSAAVENKTLESKASSSSKLECFVVAFTIPGSLPVILGRLHYPNIR